MAGKAKGRLVELQNIKRDNPIPSVVLNRISITCSAVIHKQVKEVLSAEFDDRNQCDWNETDDGCSIEFVADDVDIAKTVALKISNKFPELVFDACFCDKKHQGMAEYTILGGKVRTVNYSTWDSKDGQALRNEFGLE